VGEGKMEEMDRKGWKKLTAVGFFFTGCLLFIRTAISHPLKFLFLPDNGALPQDLRDSHSPSLSLRLICEADDGALPQGVRCSRYPSQRCDVQRSDK